MALEKDDLELDQLLSRGRLSGAQYDSIEKRVLERTLPKARAPRWPVLLAAAFASAGAMALVIGRNGGDDGDPGFRSKGAETATGSIVDVGCGGTRSRVCKLGDTLMFSVANVDREGYLAAYAESVDSPDEPRIWYFPTSDGDAPRVTAQSGTTVLSQGIRLGAPHEKGKYRMTLWISELPVDKKQPPNLERSPATSVVIDITD